MTLLSRIHENQCKVRLCARERAPDSDVCRSDLSEKWANRLDRNPDGSYSRRRTFAAREDGSWRVAA